MPKLPGSKASRKSEKPEVFASLLTFLTKYTGSPGVFTARTKFDGMHQTGKQQHLETVKS